ARIAPPEMRPPPRAVFRRRSAPRAPSGGRSWTEPPHQIDHFRLFVLGQVVVERQPHQPVAHTLGNRTLALATAEARAHFRSVQRGVMENGEHAVFTQVPDQSLPRSLRWQDQVVHVIALLAMFGNAGHDYAELARPVPEVVGVELP